MAENSVLEKLVEYILLELLEAQNTSNEKSARLAENYKSSGPRVPNLEFFPIPNSSIKAFDFKLKFALKDIGVVLTDDALSKINILIEESWVLYLTQLVNEGIIIEERKNKYLKQLPTIDLTEFKSKISEKDKSDKSISSILEKEILLAFETSVNKKSFWGVTNKVSTHNISSLNLEEKINQILFNSDKEQEIPLTDFKAVFDLNQLNNITEDIVCSINVHVEMRNFESAYYNHENDNNMNTRILTLK